MVKYLAIVFTGLSLFVCRSLPAASGHPVKPPEGCYARANTTSDFASGESDKKISFIHITKKQDRYFIQGLLWGANWHMCDITSEEGLLPASLEDGALVYRESYMKEDIHCRLEVEFKNEGVELHDRNGQCADKVFACGVRTSIEGTYLPGVQDERMCQFE